MPALDMTCWRNCSTCASSALLRQPATHSIAEMMLTWTPVPTCCAVRNATASSIPRVASIRMSVSVNPAARPAVAIVPSPFAPTLKYPACPHGLSTFRRTADQQSAYSRRAHVSPCKGLTTWRYWIYAHNYFHSFGQRKRLREHNAPVLDFTLCDLCHDSSLLSLNNETFLIHRKVRKEDAKVRRERPLTSFPRGSVGTR